MCILTYFAHHILDEWCVPTKRCSRSRDQVTKVSLVANTEGLSLSLLLLIKEPLAECQT